jgi:hypothetical protein
MLARRGSRLHGTPAIATAGKSSILERVWRRRKVPHSCPDTRVFRALYFREENSADTAEKRGGGYHHPPADARAGILPSWLTRRKEKSADVERMGTVQTTP